MENQWQGGLDDITVWGKDISPNNSFTKLFKTNYSSGDMLGAYPASQEHFEFKQYTLCRWLMGDSTSDAVNGTNTLSVSNTLYNVDSAGTAGLASATPLSHSPSVFQLGAGIPASQKSTSLKGNSTTGKQAFGVGGAQTELNWGEEANGDDGKVVFSFWMKHAEPKQYTSVIIDRKGAPSDAPPTGYRISLDLDSWTTSSLRVFFVNDQGTSETLAISESEFHIKPHTWYFVMVTIDFTANETSMTIATSDGSSTDSGSFHRKILSHAHAATGLKKNLTGPFVVGNEVLNSALSPDNTFNGKLDEMAIWTWNAGTVATTDFNESLFFHFLNRGFGWPLAVHGDPYYTRRQAYWTFGDGDSTCVDAVDGAINGWPAAIVANATLTPTNTNRICNLANGLSALDLVPYGVTSWWDSSELGGSGGISLPSQSAMSFFWMPDHESFAAIYGPFDSQTNTGARDPGYFLIRPTDIPSEASPGRWVTTQGLFPAFLQLMLLTGMTQDPNGDGN
jgi:hypothetical protein